MKFQCPDCNQRLELESMHGGQAVQCPACGANLTAPVTGQPVYSPKTLQTPSPEVIQTLQSNIDRGAMTISQFMAQQQIEGVVDLQSTEDKPPASAILTAEQGRKYKLGDVVAAGGMGAILDAKDVNLRRGVAMKVMLEPENVSKDQILRFIQEAQVTSQLEHPSIVPVHELGVDASGNVFYTMKFVKGRSLKDILKGINEGDAKTISDYPLSHLLTIFQKVCDAMAFAHSKHVIHRDLKPENVMVGDFGEVQVMDWGLAKVLPRKKRKTFAKDEGGKLKPEKGEGNQKSQVSLLRPTGYGGQAGLSPQPSPAIDSVRGDDVGDSLKTMDGSIMGTPGFMSPEQALGETEKVDERTDIYALGAILYNILTLDVPVKATNLADLINKVTTGEIRRPTEYNQRRTGETAKGRYGDASGFKSQVSAFSSLPHCPDKRVPESLSAVAMKALEVEAHRRYQTVRELQKEIEAYQGGFATGAENAGSWKQLALFVKRNKAVSFTVLSALVVVGILVSGFMVRVNREKNIAVAALAKWRAEQEDRKRDRKTSAPSLVAAAREMAAKKEWNQALDLLRMSLEYDSGLAEAEMLQSLLMFHEKDYKGAAQAAREVMRLKPDDQDVRELERICTTAVNEGPDVVKYELPPILGRQGLYILAADYSKEVNTKYSQYRAIIEKAWPGAGSRFVLKDGGFLLTLKDASDLAPLKGIPLESLRIEGAQVKDLSPLKGMPLKVLYAGGTKVSDLSPLRGIPLEELYLNATQITDISPLKGMSLRCLDIHMNQINDISALKGMPLGTLHMAFSPVNDLTPLEGMSLKELRFTPKDVTKGIEIVRCMGTLETIGVGGRADQQLPPAQFWKKYDAGEFK